MQQEVLLADGKAKAAAVHSVSAEVARGQWLKSQTTVAGECAVVTCRSAAGAAVAPK